MYYTIYGYAAVLSAIRAEMPSFVSDTIYGRVTVPDAWPEVVRERVRHTC